MNSGLNLHCVCFFVSLLKVSHSPNNTIAMQYVPSASCSQLTGPSHFIGPSPPLTFLTGSQSSWQSAQLFTDFSTFPSLLTSHTDLARMIPISLPCSSAFNAQQQRLLLPPPSVYASPPTVTSFQSETQSETLPIRESFFATQSSYSPPQCSPSWSPQPAPLNPSPGDLEPRAVHKVASPIEDEDRNSFANKLAKNLNTASAGAPPGSDSQQTVNPLQLTLQSTRSSPLHDSPNLDFDPINTDVAGAMSDSESRSDSSLDSNSTLGNMEIDRDEPDGVQPAAHAQGEGDGPATLDSDFMGSGSDELDEPRPIAKDLDNDHGARSSFANSLAKTLNTAFTRALPGSDSVQHTLNPLQLTLQSTGSNPLHNSPNVEFDPIDADPAGARSDSGGSSDSSSDSDSTLDNMEIDRDEPDGVRPAANAQGHTDSAGARSDSESSSDSAGSDDDSDDDSDDGSDNGSDHNMPTRKLTARSPQGALLS
jgi:hypothetical protein